VWLIYVARFPGINRVAKGKAEGGARLLLDLVVVIYREWIDIG